MNQLYDKFQLENALREREQPAKAVQAEVDLLDVDDYREYRQRRQ